MASRPVGDDLSEVGRAIAWAESEICDAALPASVRDSMSVCLEEALVNLILHGRALELEKDILLDIAADGSGATATITDRCEPYDVTLATPPPGPTREDMHEGGMGLRLMRAFASRLDYESRDGRNRLTIRVQAAAQTP